MKKKNKNISVISEISGIASIYFAMLYSLILIPNIIANVGVAYNAVFLGICLSTALGCFLCAFIAKKPFGFGSYVGENSFLAFSAVLVMGYSYNQALGCAFWAGVIMLIISLSDLKKYIIEGIPNCIRSSLPVGLGLFLALLGLLRIGVVKIPAKSLMLSLGNLTETTTLMGLLCLVIMLILKALNVKMNVLFGIGITLLVAIFKGLIVIPNFTMPDFSNVILNLDIKGTLSFNYFTLIITFFIFLLNDMLAASEAVLSLEDKPNEDDYGKVMVASSVASCLAPIFGCVSCGIYSESILAVESGAKTRFVPIALGVLFLLSIFLIPFLSVIPDYICAAVLVYIGIMLAARIEYKEFSTEEVTEYIPAFTLVALTCFTINLAIGICAAFIMYLILKLFTGKFSDINVVSIIFSFLSLVFFIFYPY